MHHVVLYDQRIDFVADNPKVQQDGFVPGLMLINNPKNQISRSRNVMATSTLDESSVDAIIRNHEHAMSPDHANKRKNSRRSKKSQQNKTLQDGRVNDMFQQ